MRNHWLTFFAHFGRIIDAVGAAIRQVGIWRGHRCTGTINRSRGDTTAAIGCRGPSHRAGRSRCLSYMQSIPQRN